jgi:hypothetical protein
MGDREKYGAYAKNFRASVTALFGWNIGVRFDEYFRPAMTSSVGPFVALGNPEDYIPSEGAFRLYANDSDWKEHLDWQRELHGSLWRSETPMLWVGNSII